MLTYADVCSRMLTYAHVCWPSVAWKCSTEANTLISGRMLTYADVCWRMLTYADLQLLGNVRRRLSL
jgi:hypothetical protein